ncbi:alpha-amlyase [Nonlabens sp. MIC269]|uniref:alpha-amylase family glycosyl hydrolase n=1 Tax=Nonlabens sp. MIC269 TaxID=1476901 RepID=UPI00071F9B6A|nr:alpha-amylase family glycosyl hydrolase [Nonlabens sp. MIC269]ALM21420.1 alpha-amlyase [Nonlabens sp. MIC269]
MKNLLYLFLACLLFTACEKDKQKEDVNVEEESTVYTPIQDSELETAIIYEANIRQYSQEGTFNQFTKDIPELKKLGVKVIWLMPIFPVSEKNRKAKGDLMVHDIKDPKEREKYLGSYYAVADYQAVNPDYGTQEDLRKLITTAHDNGMYVILDWVANHTGWDNWWINEHPEFYTKNEKGEIIHPKGTDWTDTADLNYDNENLRLAMIDAMSYWVKEFDVDGFRCDVAHEVPTDFWNEASGQLHNIKPLFMLAESEKKDLFKQAFDMGYNWEGHHIMNEMAQGKVKPNAWSDYMERVKENYEADDILMNFITNHDENSWNGTVKERMGNKANLFLAFQYAIPGMPLIYSGQEYGMDHRLKFFEKDTIPKTKGDVWKKMEILAKAKETIPALHGGKDDADYITIQQESGDEIIAFKRVNGESTVYFMGNPTDVKTSTTFKMGDIKVRDIMTGATAQLRENQIIDLPSGAFRFLEVVNE